MKHGTPAGHAAGCRELCCRRAKLRYDKQRKADAFAGKPRTVPLLGTARRIHALQALGYSLPQIARAAGITASTLHNPTFRGATVYATTAAAVDRAFRTLSMTVPTGGYAERSRRAAAAKGWLPPLAYDDIDDPNDTGSTDARPSRWDSIDVRLWNRVHKTETCWLWTGPLTEKGYAGRIRVGDEPSRPAHAVVYRLLVGPVPDGLVLDHLCRVRQCVNPDHLEPVTAIENTARGAEARWSELCPNGHEPEGNRRTLPSGKTVCTECRRISDRERYERHRDKRRAAAKARYERKRNEVDEAVVLRILGGEVMAANPAERAEVCRRWAASGRPLSDLERRTGWKAVRYYQAEAS